MHWSEVSSVVKHGFTGGEVSLVPTFGWYKSAIEIFTFLSVRLKKAELISLGNFFYQIVQCSGQHLIGRCASLSISSALIFLSGPVGPFWPI